MGQIRQTHTERSKAEAEQKGAVSNGGHGTAYTGWHRTCRFRRSWTVTHLPDSRLMARQGKGSQAGPETLGGTVRSEPQYRNGKTPSAFHSHLPEHAAASQGKGVGCPALTAEMGLRPPPPPRRDAALSQGRGAETPRVSVRDYTDKDVLAYIRSGVSFGHKNPKRCRLRAQGWGRGRHAKWRKPGRER